MNRSELTDQMARVQLAGAVRNHCAQNGTSVIFSPWVGLELSVRDGTVYRVQNQQYTPVLSVEEILDGASDEAIEYAVLQHAALQ